MELDIPEMQSVFRTAPHRISNFWIYYDSFNESIISLNSDFTFNKILIKRGEGPQEIQNIYSHSVTEEYIFIMGPMEIVVFDRELNLLGNYSFGLDMAYSVIQFNDSFLTAGFNEEDDKFSVYSFNFTPAYEKITLIREYDFDSKYINERIYYSHKLLKINDSKVLLIFDWYGEYFLFDHNYNILKTDLLPFSGDIDYFLDESVVKPPYYQAYDTEIYNDSLIYIIR